MYFDTVATSDRASERQKIRARLHSESRGNVSISAANLCYMTRAQILEALGLNLTLVADSEHELTSKILDEATEGY